MNFRWLDKQMSSGAYKEPLELVNRIMESAEIWKDVDIVNIDDATNALVQYVMALESLSLSEKDFGDLYFSANFGLLAGMFESASKTTSKEACHPDIWNAMSRLSQVRSMERGEDEVTDADKSFLFLCKKTTEAGYVMGKLGGLTLGELFKRWDS